MTTPPSKLNGVLEEAKAKLLQLNAPPTDLTGKVVVAYDEEDLLDMLKGVKAYPAVGIIYEGMRSVAESGPTAKIGISNEIRLSFALIEHGNAVHSTHQKKTRAIDYLEAMRYQFMGEKSTVTGHFWHFLVEAPASLKAGTVVWVQRWSLPVQLPHNR